MISQISGTAGATTPAVETPKRADQLGRDAFLRLLTPDAPVLSTREVIGRVLPGVVGHREIELMAAAERPMVPEDRHSDVSAAVPPPSRWRRLHSDGQTGETARAAADRAIDQIAARLEAGGLAPELAKEIAATHPVQRRRGADADSLKARLARQLTPLASGGEPYAAIEVFVGPPGVGKTTRIAKIAAGTRPVGTTARDARRRRVPRRRREQLRLYADILGAPFFTARTPEEFSRTLDSARRPLLVDTAGRSPSDDVAKDMFRALSTRRDVRTHLVIRATTTPRFAERLFDRFADARPSRVVLTRLDEADSIGPLVAVLRARQLPLSYVGTGQNVPGDLQPVTAPVSADWVMEEMTQGAVA